LQFSRTLNLCPEIEKLSVVVIEKSEGAIWLKKYHRGVCKIAEQRGPYSVLLLKARMLAPSHGDRSKLHNSIQSMRASQWTALNRSCNWVQDIFTLHFGLFSNFQTLALDDYHIKPPQDMRKLNICSGSE